jgi:hypothetical protein
MNKERPQATFRRFIPPQTFEGISLAGQSSPIGRQKRHQHIPIFIEALILVHGSPFMPEKRQYYNKTS